jgi:prepilin-type processing-associated H-X9-DG protein
LQYYIQGVMGKALHHAPDVNEICLAVIGAIVWKKDKDSPLEVRTHGGKIANVLFVFIGGNRYAFSYDRDEHAIDIRENNTRGRSLRKFKNSDSVADVWEFFDGL